MRYFTDSKLREVLGIQQESINRLLKKVEVQDDLLKIYQGQLAELMFKGKRLNAHIPYVEV